MPVRPLIEVDTPRLHLGQWCDGDLDLFAEMSADPAVMRYFPHCLTRSQSDAMARRCRDLIAERGWGFWAVRLRQSGAFIGFVGLHQASAALPFAPCVEIGWRLHSRVWRCGYATEAARAALNIAFDTLGLDQVVAFTAVSNRPSQALMRRLGMRDTGRNFRHPDLPADHPLAEHVLYAIDAKPWRAARR